jgi:phosphomethylpyrimidine synthase
MKITQEVREYAAGLESAQESVVVSEADQQALDDAIKTGMEEMADQYNRTGRQLYHKV